MKAWQKEAIKMQGQGMPVRQIAKLLGKSYHTVYVFLRRHLSRTVQIEHSKFDKYYNTLKNAGLIESILNLLTQTTERKGKKIPVSINQIYLGLAPTLQLHNISIKKSRFYEFIKYLIVREYGSIEKFNNTVYQTKTKNRDIKGTVKRLPATIEVDATGISWQGKLYFVLLAMDLETGYIFKPYYVESRDTGAKYYNTAINSYDVAIYLRNLFIEHGIPKAIKTDNEETLKSQLIETALKELKIKHIKTKPYNPQQKLIERAIRTLKDNMTLFKDEAFEKALQRAIDHYNSSEHKYKEYKEKIIPAELFYGYDEADEELIRRAFREKFERVLSSDMTITINKDKYEVLIQNQKIGLYGAEGKTKVIAFRDLENKTVIDIYTEQGEYIGIGKLITQTEMLDILQERQQKNKERRLQRREAKLKQELTHIEQEREQKQTHQIDFSILEQPSTQEEKQEELSDLPDILELFGR